MRASFPKPAKATSARLQLPGRENQPPQNVSPSQITPPKAFRSPSSSLFSPDEISEPSVIEASSEAIEDPSRREVIEPKRTSLPQQVFESGILQRRSKANILATKNTYLATNKKLAVLLNTTRRQLQAARKEITRIEQQQQQSGAINEHLALETNRFRESLLEIQKVANVDNPDDVASYIKSLQNEKHQLEKKREANQKEVSRSETKFDREITVQKTEINELKQKLQESVAELQQSSIKIIELQAGLQQQEELRKELESGEQEDLEEERKANASLEKEVAVLRESLESAQQRERTNKAKTTRLRKDVAKLKTQISNLNVESRDNIQTLRDEVEVAERKLAKEIKSKRALELQATKEDQIQQEKVSRLKADLERWKVDFEDMKKSHENEIQQERDSAQERLNAAAVNAANIERKLIEVKQKVAHAEAEAERFNSEVEMLQAKLENNESSFKDSLLQMEETLKERERDSADFRRRSSVESANYEKRLSDIRFEFENELATTKEELNTSAEGLREKFEAERERQQALQESLSVMEDKVRKSKAIADDLKDQLLSTNSHHEKAMSEAKQIALQKARADEELILELKNAAELSEKEQHELRLQIEGNDARQNARNREVLLELEQMKDKYNERGKKIFQDNARLLDSLGAAKETLEDRTGLVASLQQEKQVLLVLVRERNMAIGKLTTVLRSLRDQSEYAAQLTTPLRLSRSRIDKSFTTPPDFIERSKYLSSQFEDSPTSIDSADSVDSAGTQSHTDDGSDADAEKEEQETQQELQLFEESKETHTEKEDSGSDASTNWRTNSSPALTSHTRKVRDTKKAKHKADRSSKLGERSIKRRRRSSTARLNLKEPLSGNDDEDDDLDVSDSSLIPGTTVKDPFEFDG